MTEITTEVDIPKESVDDITTAIYILTVCFDANIHLTEKKNVGTVRSTFSSPKKTASRKPNYQNINKKKNNKPKKMHPNVIIISDEQLCNNKNKFNYIISVNNDMLETSESQ
jgi:hypothetical protein